jgi:pantothenate kinase
MANCMGIGELAQRLRARARSGGGRRLLVGIAGPPAAGKSTLAAALQAEIGPSCALAPMDGYHLTNADLDARGLRARKGAPETFAAGAFVAALRHLGAVPRATLRLPAYDRGLHEPVADAIAVGPGVDIVISEGNYLLLDEAPWNDVAVVLDEVWYLTVDPATARARLYQRYVTGGRTPEVAREKSSTHDVENAAIVERTKPRASLVLSPLADGRFLVEDR